MSEGSSNKNKWIAFFSSIALIFILTILFKKPGSPEIFGVRTEFFLFGLTLLGVAILHDNTFEVAITGLLSILAIKLLFDNEFNFIHHSSEEWKTIVNLAGLLLGFGMLAKIFETSNIPELLPKYLPSGTLGAFLLLVMVFVISSFLDNIAAAMIGGAIALTVFHKKVHVGYIAAIVAASNAGGAGSVVGDTTTTMMWIEGVDWHMVLHAYVAAIPALIFFGVVAAIQQTKLQPIMKNATENIKIQWKNIYIVILILIGAILTNVFFDFPALGVWLAILVGAALIKAPWGEVPKSIKGTCFLLSLVFAASLMPVKQLPDPSQTTAFGLGFLSAVFDNIPLTKLALVQNNYDWGFLAYAVGFGGSMMWFGSSAGVAISNMMPEAKSVVNWLKNGWHVTVAYLLGFAILSSTLGWHPYFHSKDKKKNATEQVQNTAKDSTEQLEKKADILTEESNQKAEKIEQNKPE